MDKKVNKIEQASLDARKVLESAFHNIEQANLTADFTINKTPTESLNRMMAYGEIYKHEYCDYFGNNSKISILKSGYSGAVKSVDAAPSPIVFNYEGDDSDKFDPIKPSTANITLIGNDSFNMEELYTADEREYMVEHFVGSNLNWRGYIIPNGFSQDWTSGSFYMSLVASDNLATLKDFKFLNDNGTIIKGRLNHIDILLKCLNKLDINIELLTLTNIVREGGVAGEDPLYINTTDAYTFLDTFVEEEGLDFYYDNPENAFDCYTVVQTICSLYGAKLYQNKGAWRFKRINVDYGASISGQTFHQYSTSGAKIGNVAYNENIIMPCDSTFAKQQLDGGIIAMSDVYKSASVRYAYRYKQVGDKLPKIIKNQEFDGLNRPPLEFVPYDWDLQIVQVPQFRSVSIQPDSDFPPESIGGNLRIWGNSRKDSLVSRPLTEPSLKDGDRAYIEFWHKLPKWLFAGFYQTIPILLRITFSSSGKTWHLRSDDSPMWEVPVENRNKFTGTWVENGSKDLLPPVIAIDPKAHNTSNSAPEWKKSFILTSPVPTEGILTISLAGLGWPSNSTTKPPGETSYSVKGYVQGNLSNINSGWRITDITLHTQEYKIGSLQIGRLIGKGSSGRIYTAEQYKKYTKRPDRLNILTADVENENLIGNVLTEGSFVDRWDDSHISYGKWRPLGALGAVDIMRQYQEVWRVVEEDIVVSGINIDTTFVFEERPNERYLIQRGSFDHKECRLIGATLIQVSQDLVVE